MRLQATWKHLTEGDANRDLTATSSDAIMPELDKLAG